MGISWGEESPSGDFGESLGSVGETAGRCVKMGALGGMERRCERNIRAGEWARKAG